MKVEINKYISLIEVNGEIFSVNLVSRFVNRIVNEVEKHENDYSVIYVNKKMRDLLVNILKEDVQKIHDVYESFYILKLKIVIDDEINDFEFKIEI